MRRRKWISILALIGVLLHAGAIVRHNATMTGATLQYQALLTDLAHMCRGADAGDVAGAADLPYLPKPSDAQGECPICSGMASAFAVVAPSLSVAVRTPVATVVIASAAQRVVGDGHAVCPPARGPPALA